MLCLYGEWAKLLYLDTPRSDKKGKKKKLELNPLFWRPYTPH